MIAECEMGEIAEFVWGWRSYSHWVPKNKTQLFAQEISKASAARAQAIVRK